MTPVNAHASALAHSDGGTANLTRVLATLTQASDGLALIEARANRGHEVLQAANRHGLPDYVDRGQVRATALELQRFKDEFQPVIDSVSTRTGALTPLLNRIVNDELHDAQREQLAATLVAEIHAISEMVAKGYNEQTQLLTNFATSMHMPPARLLDG